MRGHPQRELVSLESLLRLSFSFRFLHFATVNHGSTVETTPTEFPPRGTERFYTGTAPRPARPVFREASRDLSVLARDRPRGRFRACAVATRNNDSHANLRAGERRAIEERGGVSVSLFPVFSSFSSSSFLPFRP
jgi:hypothetical protein